MAFRFALPTLVRGQRRSYHAAAALRARIGFIGLGHMGKPMALNLLRAGNELVVFDINSTTVQEFGARGAEVAENPAAVARSTDIIVTMLPSSPHVQSVYENSAGGLLTAAKPGTLLIDCSTIDPTVTRSLASAALGKKLRMIDAPVSGGVSGAEAATLTFMVGGSATDFEAGKPLLSQMGRNIVHCGGSGAGEVIVLHGTVPVPVPSWLPCGSS